jgi:hypothetical protein
LYKVAASVLADFSQGKDSVKNLVYQARWDIASLSRFEKLLFPEPTPGGCSLPTRGCETCDML